jgi:DNA polymerase-3 subunit delta'
MVTAPHDVFAGYIGNDAAIGLLREDAARPSQAYLFVGPSNVGKAEAARRFIAELLGGPDADVRRRVHAGTHPDVVLVEPDGRTAITVDQARRTIGLASLAPMEADRKVFLFEEGGMMNDEAANALLKTLEEPTASTVFVIVAESEDDLPDTVASRCRTVVFGRVGETELAAGLERLGIEAGQAKQAARIAGGRPGLAIALATRPEVARFRAAWLGVPMRLSEHPGDAFVLADEVTASAEPLLEALRDRQGSETDAAGADAATGRVLRERHEREMKRATAALYVSGLEILASCYRDVAAAQVGAAVRNPDLPLAALTSIPPASAVAAAATVLDSIDALRANQRPQLALAALFSGLGARG